jgi:hypothetical protein
MPFPVGFFFTSLTSLAQQLPSVFNTPAKQNVKK